MELEYGKCRNCRKKTAISVNTQTEDGLLCVGCQVADHDTVGQFRGRVAAALQFSEKQPKGEPRLFTKGVKEADR